MTTKGMIQQAAIEIANQLKENALRLDKELQKIKARAAQIEAQMHSADLCHQRLSNFQAQIGGDFQCPRCWVCNEARSSLKPISSETSDDLFRCRVCGYEISIPM